MKKLKSILINGKRKKKTKTVTFSNVHRNKGMVEREQTPIRTSDCVFECLSRHGYGRT
jgi:hypothetical protein